MTNNQAKKEKKDSQKNGTPMSFIGRLLLGIYMTILPIILIYLVITFWPRPGSQIEILKAKKVAELRSKPQTDEAVPSPQKSIEVTNPEEWQKEVNLLGWKFDISYELRLLLLVLLAGALGSYIHAATSYVDFAGNRKLLSSWAWWYILRPFIGMVLSLIFYLVLRSGLLIVQTETSTLKPFSILAFAALSGMFSKQVIDKLRELLDTFFRVRVEDKKDEYHREDKLKE